MPFAGYKDFKDCVARNGDKDNPQAYCAAIQRQAEKRMRIVEKAAPRRYTLGIVYEPDVVDSQDDYASPDDIEQAAWDFMRKLQTPTPVTKLGVQLLTAVRDGPVRVDLTDVWDDLEKGHLGTMHDDWDGVGDIVESYLAPADFQINGEQVKKGSWLLGVVWSPEAFQKVQRGDLTGFSLGGRGRRVPDAE